MIAERVQKVVRRWAAKRGWTDVPRCELERPALEVHGDYATPFCMQLARRVKEEPRRLAEELRSELLADPDLSSVIEKIEVAGPGFLNFSLSRAAYLEAMRELLAQGEDIGRGEARPHPRINLEFVSVNPNGPLHVGHGRYAAYGDSLQRLLKFSGAEVATEFYINDYGRQMDRFGRSIAARYAQSFEVDLPVPSDGYQGGYVKDLALAIRAEVDDRYLQPLTELVKALDKGVADEDASGARSAGERVSPAGTELAAASGGQLASELEEEAEEVESVEWPEVPGLKDAVAFFRARGCQAMLESIRCELEDFGVVFDCWFSETSLHDTGRVRRVVDRLLAAGEAYWSHGAVWLRTTSRGDDKDRVLIRSDGEPTYFAADIAYHESKLERGFEHLINIWGADHHGYVPRMKAAVEILSGCADTLEVIIGQLVNLLEKGELKQMSTRRGEMVTLAELAAAIGVDAARFFLVSRSHDQTLDLDLDLAQRQSQENPVYYVQYAHARIASILRNLPGEVQADVADEGGVYDSPYERALIKRLESFASVVQDAAERRAPHRVTAFAQDLAADFHVFYKHCRVIGTEPPIAASRLALCLVTKRVIARCLDLLGVSAPETM